MKRILSFLLCILLLCSLFPAAALAEDGEAVSPEDTEAEITTGEGVETDSDAESEFLLGEADFTVNGVFDAAAAWAYYLTLSEAQRLQFSESLQEESRLLLFAYGASLSANEGSGQAETGLQEQDCMSESAGSEPAEGTEAFHLMEEEPSPSGSSEVPSSLTLQYGECYLFEGAECVTVPEGQTAVAVSGTVIQGTALTEDPVMVTVDGVPCFVSVCRAKVNVILIDGQSNADGTCGRLDRNAVLPGAGTASVWLWDGTGAVPQLDSMPDMREYVEALEQSGSGRSVGIAPALAAELYALTGARSIVIDTGRPGAPIQYWAAGYTDLTAVILDGLLSRLAEADVYEICSGGYYWYQGESNSWTEAGGPNTEDFYYTTAIEYRNAFSSIHRSYINVFSRYGIAGYGAVMSIRSWSEWEYLDSSEYCGVRAAQQYLVNSCGNLYMASTVTDGWSRSSTQPVSYSALSGLYTVNVSRTCDLFDTVHYTQSAYDIMGLEAADSIWRGWFRGISAGSFHLTGQDGSHIYKDGDTIYLEDNMRYVGAANYNSEYLAAQLVAVPEPFYGTCGSLTMTLSKVSDGSAVIGVLSDDGYFPNVSSVTEPMKLTVTLGSVSKCFTLSRRSYPAAAEQDIYAQIPDGNFRTMLKVLYPDLTLENAGQITELPLDGCGIRDLTGIGLFPNLEKLSCADNMLTSIDLSQNGQLLSLNCSGNRLTELKPAGCERLEVLDCSRNILASLDFSNLTGLKELYCTENRLSCLDLSGLSLSVLDAGQQTPVTPVPVYKTSEGLLLLDAAALVPEEYSDRLSVLSPVSDSFIAGGIPAAYFLPAGTAELKYAHHTGFGDMTVTVPLTLSDSMPAEAQQSYVLLNAGESFVPCITSALSVVSGYADCVWSVSDINGRPAFGLYEENGRIYARTAGSYLLDGFVHLGGHVLNTLTVRADVSAAAPETAQQELPVCGVSLSDRTVSLELYSTNYTRLSVLIQLDQLAGLQSVNLLPQAELPAVQSSGIAVESARFSGKAADLFDLYPAGDRTLVLVPRYSALEAEQSCSGSIPARLKDELFVTVNGTEYSAGTVTLNVSKKLPSVTAKQLSFNSFYTVVQSAKMISFSGGTVTGMEPDDSFASPVPSFLRFDSHARTLLYNGPSGLRKSATLRLLCTVDGWAVKIPVSLRVSVSPFAPSLKLSAQTVNLTEGAGDEAVLTWSVSPALFSDTSLYSLTAAKVQEGKTVYGNGEVLNITVTEGQIRIAPVSGLTGQHTYRVTLNIAGKEAGLTVRVYPQTKKPVSLTLRSSGFIDLSVPGSRAVITPAIKNVNKEGTGYPWLHITGLQIMGRKSGQPDLDATDLFVLDEYDSASNRILIKVADGALPDPGYTYFLSMTAECGTVSLTASQKFTVKQSPPERVQPAVSASLSGMIDVIRPASTITVTPKVKNCPDYVLSAEDISLYVKENGSWGPADSGQIRVRVENGRYLVSAGSGLDAAKKYALRLTMELRGVPVSAPKFLPINVKMGKAVVKADRSAGVLLLGDRYDEFVLQLTPAEDLRAISSGGVRLDAKSSLYLEVRELGGGRYAIGWKNDSAPSGLLKSGTVRKVKLSITLDGNESTSANASVPLKLTVR